MRSLCWLARTWFGGSRFVTSAVRLLSRVELRLSAGAALRGSPNLTDCQSAGAHVFIGAGCATRRLGWRVWHCRGKRE